jgi:hypothetical protein
MKMQFKIINYFLVLVIAASSLLYPQASRSESAPAPCVIGHTAAATGFWTWPANSKIDIYLRQPDFSEDYVAAVRVAVENWDAAAVESGSNVHFRFRGLTTETKTAHHNLTIIRGDIYDKKIKHLALLQAHSMRNDQLIDYALVVVDLRVQNPEVLTNVMAHEIGHSLGMLDCYTCDRKSTVMSLLKTGTESNGIAGPTACDKASVLTAYRDLALHLKSVAKAQPSIDDGEEPEADDTPLVRPPR